MGLGTYGQYKFNKRMMEFLKDYGIAEEDLKYLPQALKVVKEGLKPQIVEPTEDQLKKIKEDKLTKPSIEDYVKSFSNDVEEFYPDGHKPAKSNN